MKTNKRFETLEVEIGIIFGLYGSDLDIDQIREYLQVEFEEEYTCIEIEDYLIVCAKEKNDLVLVTQNFTIEWDNLI